MRERERERRGREKKKKESAARARGSKRGSANAARLTHRTRAHWLSPSPDLSLALARHPLAARRPTTRLCSDPTLLNSAVPPRRCCAAWRNAACATRHSAGRSRGSRLNSEIGHSPTSALRAPQHTPRYFKNVTLASWPTKHPIPPLEKFNTNIGRSIAYFQY